MSRKFHKPSEFDSLSIKEVFRIKNVGFYGSGLFFDMSISGEDWGEYEYGMEQGIPEHLLWWNNPHYDDWQQVTDFSHTGEVMIEIAKRLYAKALKARSVVSC